MSVNTSDRITNIDHALLLARTVRHLAPSQVAQRLRLRGQKVVLTHMPGLVAPRLQRPVPPHPGWPDGYLPLDGRLADGRPSADANAEGRFRFLDHERSPPKGHQHSSGALRPRSWHLLPSPISHRRWRFVSTLRPRARLLQAADEVDCWPDRPVTNETHG